MKSYLIIASVFAVFSADVAAQVRSEPIRLPACEKLVSATVGDRDHLITVTRPMKSGDIAETYTMRIHKRFNPNNAERILHMYNIKEERGSRTCH